MKGGSGREQDIWLQRQNRSLRDRGYRVSVELHQGLIRLRATLPPKPGEEASSSWKQRRISTGLKFPDQASDAVKLAERLGAEVERALRTQEPFDWAAWDLSPSKRKNRLGDQPTISGQEALRLTELWWVQQRRRSVSADTTWDVDYAKPLRPLLLISDLQPEHLLHLVQATDLGTRTRRRCSQAAATVAKALEMPADLQLKIRTLGRGYSPTTDSAPRNVPSDKEIEAFIDALPLDWQWPVGVCAVYGARPHEALLYADLLPTKLLSISGGKTGPRKSLALPAKWIERWDLHTKRLPAINFDRTHKQVGSVMCAPFRRAEVNFQPYDLRHAWAVRAIYTPKIGASMAAKSMGHSLQVHNSNYQKWFDASGMEAVQAQLNPAA